MPKKLTKPTLAGMAGVMALLAGGEGDANAQERNCKPVSRSRIAAAFRNAKTTADVTSALDNCFKLTCRGSWKNVIEGDSRSCFPELEACEKACEGVANQMDKRFAKKPTPAPKPVVDDDRDKDRIKNDDDKCPDRPETVNGHKDEDGCPDEKPKPSTTPTPAPKPVVDDDRNKDGIKNDDDKCPGARSGRIDPRTVEDHDDFQDRDGCPDLDNDNDKVLDIFDEDPGNDANTRDNRNRTYTIPLVLQSAKNPSAADPKGTRENIIAVGEAIDDADVAYDQAKNELTITIGGKKYTTRPDGIPGDKDDMQLNKWLKKEFEKGDNYKENTRICTEALKIEREKLKKCNEKSWWARLPDWGKVVGGIMNLLLLALAFLLGNITKKGGNNSNTGTGTATKPRPKRKLTS